MSATHPDPLTPTGCDLTDFQYMELDVRRLRDSKFASTPKGDAFRAGIMLWCAAWHQVPAASLPDDDIELARLSGAGRRWKRIRAEALHGWILCSDGRLYHPLIAEKALRCWRKKEATMRRVIRRLEIQSGEWASLRAATFARDNYRCVYCGAKDCRLEADHVVPVSAGGPSVLANLATACKPCNRAKGRKPLSEWVQ